MAAKPNAVKGIYVKKCSVSSTMGPDWLWKTANSTSEPRKNSNETRKRSNVKREIRDRVEESGGVCDYDRLWVQGTWRPPRIWWGKLKEVDAEFHVVKNRLFKQLAEDVGGSELKDGMSGRSAMVTGTG